MQNEKNIAARRAEAVEELRAAFAELESGEELTHFVGGHGIQSRVFAFEWHDESLDIAFRLPYARVLSDEDSQKADKEEIGAAIRMAILLLASSASLKDVSKIAVTCDTGGATYEIYAADGEVEDSGEDWAPLVKRFEAELGDSSSEKLTIIWP